MVVSVMDVMASNLSNTPDGWGGAVVEEEDYEELYEAVQGNL